jgi:hypothetical protein
MGVTSHLPLELWRREEIFARSIAAKLWEAMRPDLSAPLEACHTSETFCHCLACGTVSAFWNRCDRFYCPMCTAKLCFKRRQSIQLWAKSITQPKHVVLTARNTTHLSKNYVKHFKASLGKLRRQKPNTHWRGGLSSLEVTNEGRGWHLHAHLLVDADWIDPVDLSQSWGRLVAQDFAIVKVKSVSDQSYLQEVTKYAVKGSEEASWSGLETACFIDAMSGIRQFSVFGTLYKDRALRSKIKSELTPGRCECSQCASTHLRFLDHNEEEWLKETGRWPKNDF